jgi:hypothetical protein
MFGPSRRYAAPRGPRNTAPLWKKLTIVVVTVAAVALVVRGLHASSWNFFAFAALVIVVAGVTLWGTSRVLGVHLSLRSWD